MVSPMLCAAFAGVFVPNHSFVRMEEVIAKRERTNAQADFVSREINVRVILVLLTVDAQGEKEMTADKTSADGGGDIFPSRKSV